MDSSTAEDSDAPLADRLRPWQPAAPSPPQPTDPDSDSWDSDAPLHAYLGPPSAVSSPSSAVPLRLPTPGVVTEIKAWTAEAETQAAATPLRPPAPAGPSSISSAAQHTRRRPRPRKAPPVPPRAAMPVDEKTMGDLAELATMPPDVYAMPLAELAQLYPHLRRNAEAAGRADGGPDEAAHVEIPNMPIADAFDQRLQAMPRPQFELELQGQAAHPRHVTAQLHARRVRLPVSTADHESELLAAAGTYPRKVDATGTVRRYTYPECSQGVNCLAVTAGLHGFPLHAETQRRVGVPLTAYMPPDEYRLFLEDGVPPRTPRPCVLCLRHAFACYLYALRPNQADLGHVDPHFSVQLYRNLVGEEGGYRPEYVHVPREDCYEGFFDAMAGYHHHAYRAAQDPAQGHRWVVDQSLMVYRVAPPPVPPVGTTLEVASSSQ